MNIKLFLLFSICLVCQNATSQAIVSNSKREINFAFEVKHIDEFFERFNDNEAFISGYVKANYPSISVQRKALVSSLFNRSRNNWKKKDVDEFSDQIIDPVRPVYLDFDSGNWYAEAFSKFQYNGQVIDVIIVMKIQKEANGGVKWMIASAYSSMIPAAKRSTGSLAGNDHSKFINPMSHATNFISLSTALNDKSNIRDYLDRSFLQSRYSQAFLNALLSNQLKFEYVKKVRYHFLQVDDWIFTVDRFTRQSVNSGWLIGDLIKASGNDKIAYKDILLKRNL